MVPEYISCRRISYGMIRARQERPHNFVLLRGILFANDNISATSQAVDGFMNETTTTTLKILLLLFLL